MASAQVRAPSCWRRLADGATTVHQPAVTRAHTSALFRHFSVPCTVDGLAVSTQGPALPAAHDLTVPADISSAAFWMVAAASRPGSRLTLRQVGLNNTRNAVISALKRMGVRMDIVTTSPEDAGEPYGDITVYGSDSLHGTSLLPEEIPNLIEKSPSWPWPEPWAGRLHRPQRPRTARQGNGPHRHHGGQSPAHGGGRGGI